MTTTIELIKTLRIETGAGVQDCRKALDECNSNYQQALFVLREKMARQADKLSQRQASQGWLETYSHGNGRLAVIVEINTETDFAAQSEPVRALGHELALQIAAANPMHVCEQDVPTDVLTDLKEKSLAEGRAAGKPQAVLEKMLVGRVKKFMTEKVLLFQPYIRDEETTIAQLVNQVSARVGEKIHIKRFVRWEMEGEEGV